MKSPTFSEVGLFGTKKKEAMDRGKANAPFFLEFGPKESRHTAFSTESSKY